MVIFHVCMELKATLYIHTKIRECHELLLVLINTQLEHACLTYVTYLLTSDFRKQKHILAGSTNLT